MKNRGSGDPLRDGGEKVCGKEHPVLRGSPGPPSRAAGGSLWKAMDGRGLSAWFWSPSSTGGGSQPCRVLGVPAATRDSRRRCRGSAVRRDTGRAAGVPPLFTAAANAGNGLGSARGLYLTVRSFLCLGSSFFGVFFFPLFLFSFGFVSTAGVSALLLRAPRSPIAELEKRFLAGGLVAAGGSLVTLGDSSDGRAGPSGGHFVRPVLQQRARGPCCGDSGVGVQGPPLGGGWGVGSW